MTIQILPKAIRGRIAAGEVVDRPASVVKELIENAIDAGATAISVEVRDGGLGLIRVSDDGQGMTRTDASLSLERFSTSKIRSLDDLESIHTLGFRGEALSSILAVAEIDVLTRVQEKVEGTRVIASPDGIIAEPASSPRGTSVSVRGLFARFPGRRRFLKSRAREAELIQETTLRYALGHPDIAFRLTVDGRDRLVAPRSTLLGRISTVLGRDVAAGMIPVECQALDLHVSGLVSEPAFGRSRRDRQYFYVNDRPIRAGLLAVMLERPYSGRLPPGRHPLAVIYISLPAQYVDVNVHPQKAEVRFSQERSVYTLVSRAVNNALYEYPRQEQGDPLPWPFADIAVDSRLSVGEAPNPYAVGHLRVLAQLHNSYILAQTPDGLAIADQHAAHEQVLYEQFERGAKRVTLLPPAQLELTPRESQSLERILSTLAELGIEVEAFGVRAYVVRAMPASLSDQNPGELVPTLIAEAERNPCDQGELRDLLGMKAACEGAIKAGDPMALEQMQELLDALAETWSPSICPHGRPALVSITLDELARRFGR